MEEAHFSSRSSAAGAINWTACAEVDACDIVQCDRVMEGGGCLFPLAANLQVPDENTNYDRCHQCVNFFLQASHRIIIKDSLLALLFYRITVI